MSKKTKAAKHATRLRSHKKKRPNRIKLISPFVVPHETLKQMELDDAFIEMAFDQALLHMLRITGIRDALLNAIKNAPPKDEEEEGPETIQ